MAASDTTAQMCAPGLGMPPTTCTIGTMVSAVSRCRWRLSTFGRRHRQPPRQFCVATRESHERTLYILQLQHAHSKVVIQRTSSIIAQWRNAQTETTIASPMFPWRLADLDLPKWFPTPGIRAYPSRIG